MLLNQTIKLFCVHMYVSLVVLSKRSRANIFPVRLLDIVESYEGNSWFQNQGVKSSSRNWVYLLQCSTEQEFPLYMVSSIPEYTRDPQVNGELNCAKK